MVRLAPYNPQWPLIYASEEVRLKRALRLVEPIHIAHIGSTAVPGLAAKPVVDIMIGLDDVLLVKPAEELLVASGYESKGEKGIPGRLFFTFGDPAVYHLHLVEMSGSFWHEHILFRDQLREQKRIADDYLQIKLDLARMFPGDRDSYTNGKAHFIEEILASSRNP